MANYDEIRQQMELLKDEELIGILKERDKDQWRPEVFDIVSSILKNRGVPPDAFTESDADISDETEGLDIAIVANYFSNLDAETDRRALEAKGIRAFVVDRNAPKAEHEPTIELQVLADDLVQAMAILESEPASSMDLSAELAEFPCPKCGSRKVSEESEIMEEASSKHILRSKQVWLYHCADCGCKWSES
jgi:predicted RNA-binding Zn-ribbon protein involved in translation (DUF1610 family)